MHESPSSSPWLDLTVITDLTPTETRNVHSDALYIDSSNNLFQRDTDNIVDPGQQANSADSQVKIKHAKR